MIGPDPQRELEPARPPRVLYHGTAERSVAGILAHGLDRVQRRYVHLSGDRSTAATAGARYGPAVLLEVAASRMVEHGHVFYRAGNGVWLTDHVPTGYLTILADIGGRRARPASNPAAGTET